MSKHDFNIISLSLNKRKNKRISRLVKYRNNAFKKLAKALGGKTIASKLVEKLHREKMRNIIKG